MCDDQKDLEGGEAHWLRRILGLAPPTVASVAGIVESVHRQSVQGADKALNEDLERGAVGPDALDATW